MHKADLKHAFKDLEIPAFRFFKETDSTNSQALNWVSQGAPEYSLVIAEAQTAGRGRNGRKWVTTPGSSLAVSVILHPSTRECEKPGLFSLLGGYSVLKVLKENYHIHAQVKWPNDVLIENEKTAGVLAESLWQGENLQGLVLGIGINLMMPSIPSSHLLLFPATCIEAHTKDNINPVETLVYLIKTIIKVRESILSPIFIQQYENSLAYKHQLITLDAGKGKIHSGTLRGIDNQGRIIIRITDDSEQVFPIGDVKLRPQ
jgi:BirA family biotin operon repressor/biotin-[acetyl-CoA-carboxylase] ligase